MKNKIITLLVAFTVLIFTGCKVKSNMVDATVSIENKQTKTIKADKNGKWIIQLDSEKAGGPYELSIRGKNKIVIKNVLVGEVWICSGQSNMEFPVSGAMNAKQEINDSDFPMIRHFAVARDMSATSKSDLKAGKWEVCNKTSRSYRLERLN